MTLTAAILSIYPLSHKKRLFLTGITSTFNILSQPSPSPQEKPIKKVFNSIRWWRQYIYESVWGIRNIHICSDALWSRQDLESHPWELSVDPLAEGWGRSMAVAHKRKKQRCKMGTWSPFRHTFTSSSLWGAALWRRLKQRARIRNYNDKFNKSHSSASGIWSQAFVFEVREINN